MRRVGVLGGAFNPPHIGHIALAQEARWQLRLDHVRLVPTGRPHHREIPADPGRETRHELCVRAIEGQPGLQVSRLEIDRERLSYTVDTLKLLKDELPGDEFTLVIGADQAMTFESWHEAKAITELAVVAVAAREESGHEEIIEHIRKEFEVTPEMIEMPRLDVSSSDIRRRIRAGEGYSHLVPTGVFQTIELEELYR